MTAAFHQTPSGMTEPFTQVPNRFFDDVLPRIETLAELKVTLAVIRQTFGWHKPEDVISHSQFQRLAGLSKQGVSDGLRLALVRGTITRRAVSNTYAYCLAGPPSTGESAAQTSSPLRRRPESVSDADTQKSQTNFDCVGGALGSTPTSQSRAIFRAIARGSFGVSDEDSLYPYAKHIERIAAWLRQAEPSLFAAEVDQFYGWWEREHPGFHPPRSLAKFKQYWAIFRTGGVASKQRKSYRPDFSYFTRHHE